MKPAAPLDQRIEEQRALLKGEAQAIFDKTMIGVDRDKFKFIQNKYQREIALTPTQREKYVDIALWVRANCQRAVWMDIINCGRLSVLDIGSGGGHFLAVCKALGHSTLGIDLPEPKLYSDLFDLFGLQRIEAGIYANQAFPVGVERYDLITCIWQMFDHVPDRSGGRFWNIDEWIYFIDTVINSHLTKSGRLYIELNKQGNDFNRELLTCCEDFGRVNHEKGIIDIRRN